MINHQFIELLNNFKKNTHTQTQLNSLNKIKLELK